MAAPVAKFVYERTASGGLSVQFTDRSSNGPTNWSWSFGPPGAISSTQNPTFTYPTPGRYPVTLQVTNAEGASIEEKELVIDIDDIIPVSIRDLVEAELPTGVTFDENYFMTRRVYWQYFLAILVDPIIEEPNIQDETKWPTLVNMLIAKLIVYDMVVKQAESSLLSAATSSSTTTTSTSNTRGPLKAIETGPTRVEFHNASETIKQLFGSGGSEGSPFQIFLQSICMLAARLRVTLGMCPPLSQPTPPFIVIRGKRYHCSHTIFTYDGLCK